CVNGIVPGVSAADVTLHRGDREWWAYRYWKDFVAIPAVIGEWPEPFVHGFGGRPPASVSVTGPACVSGVRSALERAGAHVGQATGAAYDVRVTTFAAAAGILADRP